MTPPPPWGERAAGRFREGFGAALARAREAQADLLGDEILEIARDHDTDPSVRRVDFDTRRWLMSKHAPQIYGDKLTVAGDPAAPLIHIHRVADLIDSLSDAELDALDRFAQARIEAQEAKHDEIAENGLGCNPDDKV